MNHVTHGYTPYETVGGPISRLTAFVIPDPHTPFHCPTKTQHLLDHLADERPMFATLLGDVLDAYSISGFVKNPLRKHLLGEERDIAYEWLTNLRRATGAKTHIDLCEGNHEDRLKRILWSKVPALADLHELSIPKLLRLEENNITYHDRHGFLRFGRRFKHGDIVRQKAGFTARAEMDKHRISGFSGHTHRLGCATHTDAEGKTTEWWECGHLCDASTAEYVLSPDWQAGYLVLHIETNGVEHEVEAQPIFLD